MRLTYFLFTLLALPLAASAEGPENPSIPVDPPRPRAVAPQKEIPTEHRTLSLGDIDILQFPTVRKFEVGNSKVIRAEIRTKGEVLVFGQDLGTSSLLLRDPDGQILRHIIYSVPSANLAAKVNAIRHQLQDVEGITVNAEDGKVVIDGEVLVRADFDRVKQAADANAESVLNLVTLSKISRGQIGKKMQQEINRK